MKFLKFVLLAIVMISAAACGRIETGHTGIRTSWNKQVQKDEVRPGFYLAVTDDVEEYVTNEITMQLRNLQPQSLDRSNLKDLDVDYIYSIDPMALSEMAVQYKSRNLRQDGSIYPMGLYVDSVMRSALSKAVGEFDALDANTKRSEIESEAKKIALSRFKDEGLDGKIRIHQVLVRNIQVDPKLQESILNKIRAQKDFETKGIEVETAKREAERIAALSNQGGQNYINLLNAQATMKIAEAVANGKVNTIVIPNDFKGIVNVK